MVNKLERKIEVFNSFYPDGNLAVSNLDKIPDFPMGILNDFGEVEHGEKIPFLKTDGCSYEVFEVDYSDSGKTHVAKRSKPIGGVFEDETCLVDIGSSGDYLGHGRISFGVGSEPGFMPGKPFVGYTETEYDFLKKGFGLRRLFIMNALSQAIYGLPLNSGNVFTDPYAEGLWAKLDDRGLIGSDEVDGIWSYEFFDRPLDNIPKR